jgi:hypothetical protein
MTFTVSADPEGNQLDISSRDGESNVYVIVGLQQVHTLASMK